MDKFYIETGAYDTTIRFEVDHDDITIDEFLRGCVACALGLSFCKEQVIEAMKEYLAENGEVC